MGSLKGLGKSPCDNKEGKYHSFYCCKLRFPMLVILQGYLSALTPGAGARARTYLRHGSIGRHT
jgi:hypothetical protein